MIKISDEVLRSQGETKKILEMFNPVCLEISHLLNATKSTEQCVHMLNFQN